MNHNNYKIKLHSTKSLKNHKFQEKIIRLYTSITETKMTPHCDFDYRIELEGEIDNLIIIEISNFDIYECLIS